MAITDTRNQTWANDKTKFGYKMLQKMGWTEGKGLGVKEDGATNHIRVRRKTTNAGVGGETNLDAWDKPAEVAAGLNAVLARLAPVNCEKAVVKAEEVSKKGRGYYERRSAGKNVGTYSDRDLREIFGGINVNRKTEGGTQRLADGKNLKDSHETDGLINDNAGNNENVDGTEDDDGANSYRNRDSKEQRKRSRKEKRKKTKGKDLGIEAAIKKPKKGKKDKKRETR